MHLVVCAAWRVPGAAEAEPFTDGGKELVCAIIFDNEPRIFEHAGYDGGVHAVDCPHERREKRSVRENGKQIDVKLGRMGEK